MSTYTHTPARTRCMKISARKNAGRDKCLTLNSGNPLGRELGLVFGGGRLFEFLDGECFHVLFVIF